MRLESVEAMSITAVLEDCVDQLAVWLSVCVKHCCICVFVAMR